MREAELISRLTLAHELFPNDPLLRNEYFQAFPDEWKFVVDYHKQWGLVPNKATFLSQFPDFPFVDTETTAHWLADELAQDYVSRQVTVALTELADQNEINPRDAAKSLMEKGRSLLPYVATGVGDDVDLFDASERLLEIQRRREIEGEAGVTLGFNLLDEVTKGTQPGEIEVYFARPGIGKSFVLLYGAYAAAVQGRRVSFVSPEMTAFEMGVRLDAFTTHTSMTDLIGGGMEDDEWQQYLERIAHFAQKREGYAPISFREPQSVGRAFNTADIANIIKFDRPDIVCIDGVMLLEPVHQDKDIRKRIINIITELKEIVVETGIPIRLAHQANRQGEGARTRRSPTLDESIPHLAHMAESDSIGQYANRAIALARIANRLYLAVRKNRNQPSGRIISVVHDVDTGHFREAQVVHGDTLLDDLQAGPAPQQQNRGAIRF